MFKAIKIPQKDLSLLRELPNSTLQSVGIVPIADDNENIWVTVTNPDTKAAVQNALGRDKTEWIEKESVLELHDEENTPDQR